MCFLEFNKDARAKSTRFNWGGKLVMIDRFELENLMNKNSHLGKLVMQNMAQGLSRKLRRCEVK